MNIKQVAAVVGLVFAVTLAVVVGKQMSAEAMAVVVGIVCGVAAGIPTSLLLFVGLSRRDRQQQDDTPYQTGQNHYPPVVVIQGGAPQALAPGSQAGYWPPPTPGPAANRQFQVVGGDELLWGEGDY